MNKLTVLLMLLSVINTSCELAIDVGDDLEYSDQLVLGGVLQPDSTISISVSRGYFILDDPDREEFQVRNATVRVFEDGALLGETRESSLAFLESYAIYEFPFSAKIGSKYRVEVEKSGFPTATAEESIAADKAIAKITDVDIDVRPSDGANEFDVDFTLEIQDRTGDDYYEVLVFSEIVSPYYISTDSGFLRVTDSLSTEIRQRSPETNSLAIEDYYSRSDRIIFDDRLFEGSDFNMIFTLFSPVFVRDEDDVDSDAKLTVLVNRLSESYYNYLTSTELQRWLEGDPFAEPVQIYSNVENGLGFVGSLNSLTLEIPLE